MASTRRWQCHGVVSHVDFGHHLWLLLLMMIAIFISRHRMRSNWSLAVATCLRAPIQRLRIKCSAQNRMKTFFICYFPLLAVQFCNHSPSRRSFNSSFSLHGVSVLSQSISILMSAETLTPLIVWRSFYCHVICGVSEISDKNRVKPFFKFTEVTLKKAYSNGLPQIRVWIGVWHSGIEIWVNTRIGCTLRNSHRSTHTGPIREAGRLVVRNGSLKVWSTWPPFWFTSANETTNTPINEPNFNKRKFHQSFPCCPLKISRNKNMNFSIESRDLVEMNRNLT